MKSSKYRFLKEGEKIEMTDEVRVGENWLEVKDCLETPSMNMQVSPLSEKEMWYRRRFPLEGKVAFLVTVSATTRVVIDTTSLSDEEIDERLAEMACQKISATPNEYITPENIDWDKTVEDTECPYVEEPQYRPFKEGDVIEEGDQFRCGKSPGWLPISGPYPWPIDCSITDNPDFRKLIK